MSKKQIEKRQPTKPIPKASKERQREADFCGCSVEELNRMDEKERLEAITIDYTFIVHRDGEPVRLSKKGASLHGVQAAVRELPHLADSLADDPDELLEGEE